MGCNVHYIYIYIYIGALEFKCSFAEGSHAQLPHKLNEVPWACLVDDLSLERKSAVLRAAGASGHQR